MIIVSPVLTAARRVMPGLSVLGLALVAGLAGAPGPAAATSDSWQSSCQFKNIPGSGGEGLRYDACLRLETCRRMTDAAGHAVMQAGCFEMAPSAPSLPAAGRAAR